MNDVFFSYSRSDLVYARLAAALLSAGGNTVYLDVSELQYGLDWRAQVATAIRDAGRVLVVWSERAATSRWVLMELQLAHRLKKMIIPILLDKTPVPRKLKHIHAVTELGEILLRLIPDPGNQSGVAAKLADKRNKDRSQKFIARNRSPRVSIDYEMTPIFKLKLAATDVEQFQRIVFSKAEGAA